MWAPKLTWQGHKKDERALRIWTLRLLTMLIVIQKRPLTAILQFYGSTTINGNWLMTEPCEPIVHRTVFCQKQGAEKEEGEVSKKADLKRVPRGFELLEHHHQLWSFKKWWQKWVIDWFDWFKVIKLFLINPEFPVNKKTTCQLIQHFENHS